MAELVSSGRVGAPIFHCCVTVPLILLQSKYPWILVTYIHEWSPTPKTHSLDSLLCCCLDNLVNGDTRIEFHSLHTHSAFASLEWQSWHGLRHPQLYRCQPAHHRWFMPWKGKSLLRWTVIYFLSSCFYYKYSVDLCLLSQLWVPHSVPKSGSSWCIARVS